jgi:hypothetical protein
MSLNSKLYYEALKTPIVSVVVTFLFFGDFELIVNLVRKIYSPSNKMMERYTQTIWALISNLLSFNITHVKRELNLMDDWSVLFVASPIQ